jgi:oxygen-independent coproporphyrinogen-3 oxidase
VQSLDAARLRYLGRLHDPDGALRAIDDALHEMPRVSGDLMFGMPGQRADDFAAEVERLLATGVRHVSAYALTIEPDTQFGALHRKGKLEIAPDDDYAETFVRAHALFASRGLMHYEVSNYAAPGEEARHNLHYWRGGDYLGLGAGAVGCLSRPDRSAHRTKNDPRPDRYMAEPASAVVFEETLSPDDRIREALMLGLRTAGGVDLAALEQRTSIDPRRGRERAIERRAARGDVVFEGTTMRVPPERWLMLDGIVTDLF